MDAAARTARLTNALEAMRRRPVLVIGDVMLDHYLTGEVERISPEAPVPVVKVAAEGHMAGGAGNVAVNIAALGAKPFLLSAVGDDAPGGVLTTLLEREGIEAFLVRDPSRPTTIKTRVIAHNQQVVRIDRETDAPLAGAAVSGLASALAKVLPGKACVVISDYAKGVITDTLLEALRQAMAGMAVKPLVLVDPKPVHAALYAGADVLTPNLKEAGEISGIRGGKREDVLRSGLAVFRKCKCRHLCITLGPQGIALFTSPGDVTHIPTAARRVFDVTGAGDCVIAALAAGLAAGLSLLDACVLANVCAGISVAQVGAVAVTPGEIVEALSAGPGPELETWLESGDAPRAATAQSR